MPSKLMFLILGLLLLKSQSYGQQIKISGTISAENKGVVAATILIKQQNKILAYTSSDERGFYSLQIPKYSNLDSIFLEVRHLAYKPLRKAIVLGDKQYSFELKVQSVKLNEVQIKTTPKISRKKDTLVYKVEAFSKSEDRSIGEVLSRMPGMNVKASGEIEFNGKRVTSLYIDKVNLLGSKYGLGTKSIPHGIVQNVEVLQNHVAQKVLENKQLSNQVALNLVIKDEAKLNLNGKAVIGLGLPKQYDSELNAMLFRKKIKMLQVIQGNNIGKDPSINFMSKMSASNASNLVSGISNQLLTTGTIVGPPINQNLYNFNHSALLNSNNHFVITDTLKLRINIHQLLDQNRTYYKSFTENYLPNDTLRFIENQNIKNSTCGWALAANLELNKSKYYINNDFMLYDHHFNSTANLANSQFNLKQKLQKRNLEFSNSFEYIPELKNKNILFFSWQMYHYDRPEKLNLQPKLFDKQLNIDDMLIHKTKQSINIPTFFNHISVAYQFNKGSIKHSYKMALLNEYQKLSSDLSSAVEEQKLLNLDTNQLKWKRQELYFIPKFETKFNRWEHSLQLLWTLQNIHYQDAIFSLNRFHKRLYFNPKLSSKYFISGEDFLSFHYQFHNQVGNITQLFQGNVMTNYRSFTSNESTLQEQYGHQVGLKYNLQRSLKMFFGNAYLNYRNNKAKTILASTISNQRSIMRLIPFDNSIQNVNIGLYASKYLDLLKGIFKFQTDWGISHSNLLINEKEIPVLSNSITLNPSFDFNINKKLSLKYHLTQTWYQSRYSINNTLSQRNFQYINVQNRFQKLAISYKPFQPVFIQVSVNHYQNANANNNVSYFFADSFIRYHFKNWKSDLEAHLTNMTNLKSYETFLLTGNQLSNSNFRLRGSMCVFKYALNF